MIGMAAVPPHLTDRTWGQHLRRPTAHDEMVDELLETGIASRHEAKGRQMKRCGRRRQHSPHPVAGYRETAIEVTQDDERHTPGTPSVGPGLEPGYLIAKNGAGLIAPPIPVLLRTPAARF